MKSIFKAASQEGLDTSVISAFRRLGWFAVGAVYASGGMGLLLILKAIACFVIKHLHFLFSPEGKEMCESCGLSEDPLYTAIAGLEFLFMSPLAYLVFRSLAEYVEDLKSKDALTREAQKREIDRASKELEELADKGQSSERQPSEHKEIEKFLTIGKEGLLETKALTIALLFAIVATHLIGMLIGGHGKGGEHHLNTTEGTIALLLLGVLAAIYFGIELLTSSLKRRDHLAAENQRGAK